MGLVIALVTICDAALASGVVARASTDSSWLQSNDSTFDSSLSTDGHHIVFSSRASNLVEGDTNGASDIFLKDIQTGQVILISTNSEGNQSDGFDSWHPSLSANGRYVAFSSSATTLVPGDTNSASDIFVKDLETGETRRVSTDSLGNQSDNYSYYTSISGDGRYIAFRSSATNLVPGDTNGTWDIFLKDLLTGVTTRVSTSSAGEQGDAVSSYFPKVSADGQYVVFSSSASNLVDGDDNGAEDIFMKDTQTGTTSLVSTDASGGFNEGGSYYPNISPDARYIAFISIASDLVSNDTNGTQDVFVKDMLTGSLTRVSSASDGTGADAFSDFPVISGDGSEVAFYSSADNLVPGDTNGLDDVFVKDLETGMITILSTDSSGAAGNGNSRWPAISGDGRLVSFYSYADNLVPGDTNGAVDIMLAATPWCTCAQPELTLNGSTEYWRSLADYNQQLLSCDFQVTRSEGMGVINVVGAINTGGVTMATPMPTSLSYTSGNGWDFTIKYYVPTGVNSFRSTLYAKMLDNCGQTHEFPGPWR